MFNCRAVSLAATGRAGFIRVLSWQAENLLNSAIAPKLGLDLNQIRASSSIAVVLSETVTKDAGNAVALDGALDVAVGRPHPA
jgi:hypothetical protein